MKILNFLAALSLLLPSISIFAEPLVLENSTGDNFVVDINLEDSFSTVLKEIANSALYSEALAVNSDPEAYLGYNMNVRSNGAISVQTLAKKQTTSVPRDYWANPSQQEVNDITYIVRTLANESLLKIKKEESSLKRTGDRVDHLHPFQFLLVIFTNELSDANETIAQISKMIYDAQE